MQRPLDARPVVFCERTDTMNHVVEVFTADGLVAQVDRACGKPGFGLTPQIHHDFNERFEVGLPVERFSELWRHDTKKEFKVISDFLAGQFASPCHGPYLLP